MWIIWIGLVLLLLSLLLVAISHWQRIRTGLPAGRVVYIDTMKLRHPEASLFSANYSLTGKPDFLVNQWGRIIPIEVKSGNAPVAPYPSHIFQLAAYALLVQEQFGEPPPLGILKYRDRALEIPFTPRLMDQVRELLEEMQADSAAENLDRSHTQKARCRSCGYRNDCDQSLI